MYQALYRKWRPQTFDDVIGQQHITEPLKKQVMTGRLSHAYIFIGTRGTGKTTCARILAKAVNCENPVNGNPCGKCSSCLAIGNGEVMDIVELDAASNNSVDNVRALREEAVFSPTQVKKRVYIIDEVHMLSGSAFNALLKILEEPPEHLIFILATTELQKVPATILSRCQRHSFRRINQNILSTYLMQIADKECIRLSKNGAELIAGLAEGGVRDALSMLDQCSAYDTIDTEEIYSSVGLAGNKRTMQLFDLICNHDAEGAISLFNTLWMDGRDPASLLRELSTLVRDILLMRVAPLGAGGLIYGGFERATIKAYAEKYRPEQLSAMLEKIQQALANMRDMLSPKITAELCIISLCSNIAGDTLRGLGARVSELEKAVVSGGAFTKYSEQQNITVNYTESSDSTISANDGDSDHIQNRTDDVFRPEARINMMPTDDNSHTSDNAPGILPVAAGNPDTVPVVEAENMPEAEVVTCENYSDKDTDLWVKISERVRSSLTKDCLPILPNICAERKEDLLILKVKLQFQADRLNRNENLEKIAATASLITGKNITVMVQIASEDGKVIESRSLEELKKFKEVNFI